MKTCITGLIAVLALISMTFAQEQLPAFLGRDTHMWQDGVCDVRVFQQHAYLAQEEEGLRVVDVSDPLHPVEIAHFADVESWELEVEDGLLVVRGRYESPVLVYSLEDPAAPVLLASLELDFRPCQIDLNASRLAVFGVHDEAGNNQDDLVLYDLSDPMAPSELAHYYGMLTYCQDLELDGNQLLVAGGFADLIVVDLSDLEAPMIQSMDLSEYGTSTYGVLGFGSYACLGAGEFGFWVVDLTTMEVVGSLPDLWAAYQLRTDGELVYLSYGADDCPVAAIDLSYPALPAVLGEYAPEFDVDFFCIEGEYVFCAGQAYGLRVVSFEDPDDPQEVAYLCSRGDWGEFLMFDDHAACFETAGVQVIDLSDPQNPQPVWQTLLFHALYTLKHENLLFAVGVMHDLVCIDMSMPESPQLLSSTELPCYVVGPMCVWHDQLLVPAQEGLLMYDIQDPANLTLADTLEDFGDLVAGLNTWQDMLLLHGGLNWDLYLLELVDGEIQISTLLEQVYSTCRVRDNLLYFENYNSWQVADLSALPEGPLQVQNVEGLGSNYYGSALARSGDFLYLPSSLPECYYVHIYDNRDPAMPQLLGSIPTEYCPRALYATQERLYVDQDIYLDIYDVSQIDVAIEAPPITPGGFELLSCFPNPFNPSTTVAFHCPHAAKVDIAVYNLLGKRITGLAQGEFAAGEHSVNWNGRDTQSMAVASGTYFIVAAFPDGSRAQTVTLLK